MPMTLISLLARVISSRCTMSLAISPPGRPRRTSIYLQKHEKWWLYERPGPPCRLHHRSREEPAGRSSPMNILGITIDERLSVSDHVDATLNSCSSSLNALRTLIARGMPKKILHQVTAATTIGRLMYGSPTWWGYSSKRDLNGLDSCRPSGEDFFQMKRPPSEKWRHRWTPPFLKH